MSCNDISKILNSLKILLGDMFKVLESNNKIYTLSLNILHLAFEYKVSNKKISRLREIFSKEAYKEVKMFEKKKL